MDVLFIWQDEMFCILYCGCSSVIVLQIQVALGEPGKQKLYAYEYGSKEVWRASVLKKFPGEEKAVDKFIQLLQVCLI